MKTSALLIQTSIIILWWECLDKRGVHAQNNECHCTLNYERASHDELRRRFSSEYNSATNAVKNFLFVKWINPLAWMRNKEFRKLCHCFLPFAFPGEDVGPNVGTYAMDSEKNYPPQDGVYVEIDGSCFGGGGSKKFDTFYCIFKKRTFCLTTGSKNYGVSGKFDAYVSLPTKDEDDVAVFIGVAKAISC